MRKSPDAYLTIAVNLTMSVDEAQDLAEVLADYPSDHPTTPLYEQLEAALERVPEMADDE